MGFFDAESGARGSAGRALLVCDLKKGTVLATIEVDEPTTGLAFLDDDTLVTAHSAPTLSVWDLSEL